MAFTPCTVDQSAFDKDLGAKYTFIFAGEKKVDGNPPATTTSESAKGDPQAEVDREYGIFVETVARNRKASAKTVAGTQAGLFWPTTPSPLLADQVGALDDALAAITGQLDSRKRASVVVNQRGDGHKSNEGVHMSEEVQALAAKRKARTRPTRSPRRTTPEHDTSGRRRRGRRRRGKGQVQEGCRQRRADWGRSAKGHARRIRHPGHRRALQGGGCR
jgi:ClpP class serine protease